jgi:hypothetical protein
MECLKTFTEDEHPTINGGDGCCSIGSLIEVDGYTVKRKTHYGEDPRKFYAPIRPINNDTI